MTSTDTRDESPAELADDGAFRRRESIFRDHVTADGSSGYRAEAGRYHLYVSYACPWAHRTILYRDLKGLEGAISMTVVDPERDERGWAITNAPGTTPDPVNHFMFLSEGYVATDPGFDGRVTVPVLWDRRTERIVNNESSEIIRMLNAEFDAFGDRSLDLYPEALRRDIDEVNAFVYANVNNGVYRCGLAKSQAAYEESFRNLFAALDELETRLGRQRWLVGDRFTEADLRLFPTLVRFDTVYYVLFKCNRRRLVDYPNLWNYTREIYQMPGVAETVDFPRIKLGYYGGMRHLNNGILPLGPDLDFAAPHDRARFG
jgi:glutathionyl-hydroquinone reductase